MKNFVNDQGILWPLFLWQRKTDQQAVLVEKPQFLSAATSFLPFFKIDTTQKNFRHVSIACFFLGSSLTDNIVLYPRRILCFFGESEAVYELFLQAAFSFLSSSRKEAAPKTNSND